MHLAKPLRRLHTLKAPHRPNPLFNSSMVLLQMIVQVTVRAMAYRFPERGFDRAGIGVVSITGDPLWDTTRDGTRRAEEGFRRCLVSLLAKQDIDEMAIPINGPVQVDRAPFHFNESFIYVPTRPTASPPVLAQRLAHQRGELGFPLPHRFVGKN